MSVESVPDELVLRIAQEQECPEDCFFVQRTAKGLARTVLSGEIDVGEARTSLTASLQRYCNVDLEGERLPSGKMLEFPACSYDYGSLEFGENPFDFVPPPGWVKDFFPDVELGSADR